MARVYSIVAEFYNQSEDWWESDDSVFKDKDGNRSVYTRLYQDFDKAMSYAKSKAKRFWTEWDCEGEYGIKEDTKSYILVGLENNKPWMRFRVISFHI